MDALQAFQNLHRRQLGQSTREISEARERTARRSWMRCRPSRSLMSAALSDLPGRSPKPRRRQLAQSTRRISEAQEQAARHPGRAAAFRILKAGHTAKVPGGISQSQERECEEIDPLLLCVFSLLF